MPSCPACFASINIAGGAAAGAFNGEKSSSRSSLRWAQWRLGSSRDDHPSLWLLGAHHSMSLGDPRFFFFLLWPASHPACVYRVTVPFILLP